MSQHLGPWRIPDSWAWTTTGEVCTIVGGGTPRTADPGNFDGGEIPWITPADLSGYRGIYIGHGARSITRRGYESSGATLMPKGTVLFSSRAPIGYVAIASNEVSTNQGFKSFIPPNGLQPEYLCHYLRRARSMATALASGTTFLEISGRQAAKIPLALAPTPEQARIVEALDSYLTRLDDTEATLERVKCNLERYRASILQAAVEGRLVPTEADLARVERRDYEPASELLKWIFAERRQHWEEAELAKMKSAGKAPKDDKWRSRYQSPVACDTTDLPALPDGWCWLSVDALAFVTKLAGFEYTKFVRYDPDGDLAVIKAENAGPDGFKPSVFSFIRSESVAALMRSRLVGGDVLMVFVGNVGRVARVPADRQYFLGPNIAMIRPTTDRVLSAYLELYLRSPLGHRLALSFAKAVTQPSLSMEAIRMISVALPPLREQKRIVVEVGRAVDAADMAMVSTKASLARSSRLRQSVLRWAFGGHLVDRDPNDEPASALLDRICAERAKASASPDAPRRRGRRRKAVKT